MLTFSAELVVLVLGTLAAISGLSSTPDALKKHRIYKFFFFMGILAQVLSHFFQYTFAVNNRLDGQKEVERATAIALYAYTKNDLPLLKATSREDWLIGYRLFKNKELEEARLYFNKAIRAERSIAPSHYVLGYMSSHSADGELDRSKNWKEAFGHLNDALTYDPNYTPAYYVRAKLNANTTPVKMQEVLNDLGKAVLAVKYGTVPCADINEDEEVDKAWKQVKNTSEFVNLREECARINPRP
ncbi:MAG: hypothetical protein Q7U76_09560 [Nitrospirota bacterium]|nr:hypothetical protein [Nitrospirota bacterium]